MDESEKGNKVEENEDEFEWQEAEPVGEEEIGGGKVEQWVVGNVEVEVEVKGNEVEREMGEQL